MSNRGGEEGLPDTYYETGNPGRLSAYLSSLLCNSDKELK
jgi:hypothetical protein